MTRLSRALTFIAVAIVAGTLATSAPAAAQGNSGKAHGPHGEPPGQTKKHRVTSTEAVGVTREVLVSHGYTIVRVERVGVTQVVYYRRGNNGRGRGLGPVEKMVIRPSGERVVFESAPPKVLVDINVRLGL